MSAGTPDGLARLGNGIATAEPAAAPDGAALLDAFGTATGSTPVALAGLTMVGGAGEACADGVCGPTA